MKNRPDSRAMENANGMSPVEPSRSARDPTLGELYEAHLASCPSLTPEAHAHLEAFAKTIERHERRLAFRVQRAESDKRLSTKLLGESIDDLSGRTAELERVNEDLQQFMHVASHDLKTPLRSIGSFAGLLERRAGATLSDDAREYLGYIRTSATAMNRVIDDLVRFSRADDVGEAVAVDLDEVANEVRVNLHADLTEADAVLEIRSLGQLQAPRSALSQVLQNLIRNAIVYRDLSRACRVEVRRESREGATVIAVADNGTGLSESFRDKVFKPFQRVGDLSRPGTGMGLAICRRIARRLGGDIDYEGVVGEGTTFFLRV